MMKIAIPSEGNTMESIVCQSFGRTYYFIVADSETLEYEVIDNLAVSSQGGAGIKAAQAIADSGADVVVTFHCGQNAADMLKAADIKIKKAVPGTVMDMVIKYKAGELTDLTKIHPGRMGEQLTESTTSPGRMGEQLTESTTSPGADICK